MANLLFEPHDGLTENRILQVRIENLMRLCMRQETPRQYNRPKEGASKVLSLEIEHRHRRRRHGHPRRDSTKGRGRHGLGFKNAGG